MNLTLGFLPEKEPADTSTIGVSSWLLDSFSSPYLPNEPEASISSTEDKDFPSPEKFPWVENIYSLSLDDKIDEGLDVLYEKMDDFFLEGSFCKADDILKFLDLSRLHLDLWIGVLTVTACARPHLPSRKSFFERVSRAIDKFYPERKTALLSGLE